MGVVWKSRETSEDRYKVWFGFKDGKAMFNRGSLRNRRMGGMMTETRVSDTFTMNIHATVHMLMFKSSHRIKIMAL